MPYKRLGIENDKALRNIRFGMLDKNSMYVTGWSNYSSLDNLNKKIATEELFVVKKNFSEMQLVSSELLSLAKDKKVKYNLALDYGKGGIGICHDIDNIIIWEINIEG